MLYTDLKTIEQAYEVVNANPATITILQTLPETDRNYIVPDYNLKAVIAAINMLPADDTEQTLESQWIPDFTNYDEDKYFLWLDVEKDDTKPSGFGLSYDDCDDANTYTPVGSRLSFRSRERAKYAIDTFPELFEGSMLINK